MILKLIKIIALTKNWDKFETFVNKIALFLATVFYSGFLISKLFKKEGIGAGTVASILALFVQIGLVLFIENAFYWNFQLIIYSLLVGLITVPLAEKYILATRGGVQLNHKGDWVKEDFNETNIDEFHGQMVAGVGAMYGLENGAKNEAIFILFICMLLFRFFDIKKPWIVAWIENKFPSPTSVMLDDTTAALLASMIGFALSAIIM